MGRWWLLVVVIVVEVVVVMMMLAMLSPMVAVSPVKRQNIAETSQ